MAGVVDDALELLHRLQEFYDGLVVKFLREYAPAAECREIALLSRPLAGGLGQEQVAPVVEIRPLVEVTLKRAVKE